MIAELNRVIFAIEGNDDREVDLGKWAIKPKTMQFVKLDGKVEKRNDPVMISQAKTIHDCCASMALPKKYINDITTRGLPFLAQRFDKIIQQFRIDTPSFQTSYSSRITIRVQTRSKKKSGRRDHRGRL